MSVGFVPIKFCFISKAKSQFKRRSTANNVEIHVPVPNDADSPKFKTTIGNVKWIPEKSIASWNIKSFPVIIIALFNIRNCF